MTTGQGPSFELFGIEVQLPRTFTALRHRNYRLFWFGQMISLIGTWMQTVGQRWLVLMLTNSAFALGLVSTVTMLPVLLLSLVGGVVADRVDKRRLIIVTQACSMALAFGLAVLATRKAVQYWHILMFAAMLGTVNAFDTPTRQSFVVEMVGKEDLGNAIGLNSAMFNTARMVGPAVAGILIAAVGVAGCFWLNGVSYLAVIGGLALMRGLRVPERQAEGSPIKNLTEGFRYLWSHQTVMMLILNIAVSSIFGIPFLVLMPVYAKQVLGGGPATYGTLLSAVGIGALAGALTTATLGKQARRGSRVLLGSLTFAAFLFAFSFSRSYWLSMGLLVGTGFAMVTQNITTNSLIQAVVPDFLRGRIMSVYVLMFLGMVPIGDLQAGSVAQVLGAPWAVRIGSVACGLMALALWRMPAVRRMS